MINPITDLIPDPEICWRRLHGTLTWPVSEAQGWRVCFMKTGFKFSLYFSNGLYIWKSDWTQIKGLVGLRSCQRLLCPDVGPDPNWSILLKNPTFDLEQVEGRSAASSMRGSMMQMLLICCFIQLKGSIWACLETHRPKWDLFILFSAVWEAAEQRAGSTTDKC